MIPSEQKREALRRLAGVAASGFLAALGMAALDVVMPLWAARDLGVTATEWVNLRSLRFAGVEDKVHHYSRVVRLEEVVNRQFAVSEEE